MSRKKSFFKWARDRELEAVRYIEENVKETIEVDNYDEGEVRVAFYDHHTGEIYTLDVSEIVPADEDHGMHISGWCNDTGSVEDVYPVDWGCYTALIIADIVINWKNRK